MTKPAARARLLGKRELPGRKKRVLQGCEPAPMGNFLMSISLSLSHFSVSRSPRRAQLPSTWPLEADACEIQSVDPRFLRLVCCSELLIRHKLMLYIEVAGRGQIGPAMDWEATSVDGDALE
jgi:hypothetical protein